MSAKSNIDHLKNKFMYIIASKFKNTSCFSLSTKGHYVEGEVSVHESLSKPPDRETTCENKPVEREVGGKLSVQLTYFKLQTQIKLTKNYSAQANSWVREVVRQQRVKKNAATFHTKASRPPSWLEYTRLHHCNLVSACVWFASVTLHVLCFCSVLGPVIRKTKVLLFSFTHSKTVEYALSSKWQLYYFIFHHDHKLNQMWYLTWKSLIIERVLKYAPAAPVLPLGPTFKQNNT